MRRTAYLFLCFFPLILPAISHATNYQDWWWNPSQSGHGVSIGQQGDTLFVAWYTYDREGNAVWLTMAGNLAGNTVTGELLQTTGPALGATFDPNQVTRSVVGTASVKFTDPNNAVFQWSAYGVSGSVNLTRHTYNSIRFDGYYYGGASGYLSGCMDSSLNGPYTGIAYYSVSTHGDTIQVLETDGYYSCLYTGTYSQHGTKIAASGTVSCSYGTEGTCQSQDISVSEKAIIMEYTGKETYGGTCTIEGTFAGIKDL